MNKPYIDVSDDFFGAVLNSAVRYALGRSSYMPGLVIDYLRPLLPYLSNRTLWCMDRDIKEWLTPKHEIFTCTVSEDIIKEWRQFHSEIKEVLSKNATPLCAGCEYENKVNTAKCKSCCRNLYMSDNYKAKKAGDE